MSGTKPTSSAVTWGIGACVGIIVDSTIWPDWHAAVEAIVILGFLLIGYGLDRGARR